MVASAQDDEVRCNYNIQFQCTDSGCQPHENISNFLIVPMLEERSEELITVRRCDEVGCTPVEVMPIISGEVLNLVSGRGYLLKFVNNDFVELATSSLSVWMGYGSCRSEKSQ